MLVSLNTSPDGKYIAMKVKGKINGVMMLEYIRKAHELGDKKGISRYLLDMTEARNTDSVANNYQFAYMKVRKLERIHQFPTVAALVSPDDHSHDFVETVLVNAGSNLKIFRDHEAAVRWLDEC